MTTLRLMTWNVENLFRPIPGDVAEEARYVAKLARLAAVIANAAPDIVALQEVGGEEALVDLQLALGGIFGFRAISLFPDARGIRVAYLSQWPIELQTDIADFPPGPALSIQDLAADGSAIPVTRMGRGALHIRARKDGQAVDVIAAHLKSKLLTFKRPNGPSFSPRDENERAQVGGIALYRRAAEAITLRMRVNDLLVGNVATRLVLLGDLNDVPEAQTSLIFAGPPGSEIGSGGFHTSDKGDDPRLFNLANLIPAERRYSRVHNGRKELLDQIWASEELFPRGPDNKRRLPLVDSLVDFAGGLPSVTENPEARADEIGPDHAPVMATFEL